MREGNVFLVSVCLVWGGILTIPMSNLSIKVIGSRSLWEMGFLDCWTPNSYAMINLWYKYNHQGQDHFVIKVIQELNCKCWISIPKRAVDFRSNAFLLLIVLYSITMKILVFRLIKVNTYISENCV